MGREASPLFTKRNLCSFRVASAFRILMHMADRWRDTADTAINTVLEPAGFEGVLGTNPASVQIGT